MPRNRRASLTGSLLALLSLTTLLTASEPPEPPPEPPQSQPSDPLAPALDALRRGELETALPLLESVGPEHPGYPLALHNLGVLHERQGRLEASATAFERLLALGDQDPDALIGLAWARYRLAQQEPARAALRRALALRPADLQARYNLALVELADGRAEAASAQLAAALERDRDARLAGEALLDLEALALARPELPGLEALREALRAAGPGLAADVNPLAKLDAAAARLHDRPDDPEALAERLAALEQLAARAPRSAALEQLLETARSTLENGRSGHR